MMASFQVALMVVLLTYLTDCDAQISASFKCTTADDVLTMNFRAYDSTGEAMRISAVKTNSFPDALGCQSTDTDTVGTQTHYTIAVQTTISTLTQASPPESCNTETSGNNIIYKFFVLASALPAVITETDQLFSFSCDYTAADDVDFQTVTSEDIALTGVTTLLSETDNAVTVTLVDATNNAFAADTPILLGTLAKFMVVYTRANSETSPLYIQITDLEANDGQVTTPSTVSMLDSNGCPISPVPTEFPIASGILVNPSPPLVPATTTTVTGYTGTFPMHAFSSSSDATVTFKMTWSSTSYCFEVDDRCMDATAYCASLARRKRSVTGGVVNNTEGGTVNLKVQVSVGSAGETSNLGGRDGPTDLTEKECEAMTSFWVVSIVLGVLLLVVLVFAVMLFYRLRREQANKMVDAPSMYGVRNPTF